MFTVLDLLFPLFCYGCKKRGSLLCTPCAIKIKNSQSEERPKLKKIQAFYSGCTLHGPIRSAIHALKYQGITCAAHSMASLVPPLPQTSLLVPVPLHWYKRLQRGYNQAEIIADAIGNMQNLRVVSLLKRQRDTQSQVGLKKGERHENMRDAFLLRDTPPANTKIILIDDVCTTGATLSACAEALHQAKIRNVSAAVVAYEPLLRV